MLQGSVLRLIFAIGTGSQTRFLTVLLDTNGFSPLQSVSWAQYTI